MYDELVKRLKYCRNNAAVITDDELVTIADEAADAIEELQATLCNWCAVCPEGKRDFSTCEIYESCRAKPPKEE